MLKKIDLDVQFGDKAVMSWAQFIVETIRGVMCVFIYFLSRLNWVEG
jgi:hypothetical protein